MSKLSYRRFNWSFLIILFLLLSGTSNSIIFANPDANNTVSYFNKVFSLLEKSVSYDNLLLNEYCFSNNITARETANLSQYNAGEAFFMCAIHTQLTQTSCVDNGGGTYTANFDLAVDWSTAPASEDILVTVGGTTIATIDPTATSSPQTVSFSLDADGMGQDTIIAFFEATTACADTFAIKSPSPCPPATGGCTQTGTINLGLPDFREEATDGTVSTDISIEFGTNTPTVGLNYDNVNIPNGATITSATIQFDAISSINSNAITININGEDTDDAAAFTMANGDITNRTTTTNSVSWSPASWTSGEMGANQLTPDLATIIQEIVNRPGWNANQNMAFIFTSSGTGIRESELEAILNVEFEYLGDCGATEACAAVGGTEIAGTAWNDYDFNGVLDETTVSGFQGVQVELYDCTGNLTATTITDASGNYEFTGLTDQKYRVEFILSEELSCWVKPTHAGTNNGTMVQFVEPGNCVSLGLADPTDYCETNPFIGLTCFSEGAYNGTTSGDPAIIKLPYDAEGHDFAGKVKNDDYEGDILDDIGGLGSAYGLAWQATRQRMYLGAYHKRYSGFGANGPDAIYQYDTMGTQTGVIELDALLGGTNTAGTDVHDFVTLNNGEVMDYASFDGVGKVSFGDLEMSADMTTLYVVNLFDRKIYAIDVSDGTTANASVVNSWDVPDPSGTGIHRPFALKWHEGKLWTGIVTEDATNAYVYSLDVLNGNFNQELTVPLSYDRQSVIDDNANAPTVDGSWNAWASNPETTTYLVNGDDIAYPQPMLTDIEFDASGAMILGFRDRFGDQAASDTYFNNADATADDFTWPSTAGDILRACYNGFSYVLETGTSGACPTPSGLDDSGPNGVEYYHWDYYHFGTTWNPLNPSGGFHWETTQGALLQLANSPYVVTTAMDPYNDYSGGIIRLNNETGRREGVLANDNTAFGDLIGGYTIYESGDFDDDDDDLPPANTNGTFGKANGLGDLEAFCNPAPIEIGNFIWCDSIINGIQDACEVGMDSIIVQLYDENGLLVGQDTTVNGQYYFNQNNVDTTGITVTDGAATHNDTAWSGLGYSTRYFIVFGDGQFANEDFILGSDTFGITPLANVGSNDNIDSDVDGTILTSGSLGTRPDGLPFIDMTTSSIGCGDHQYDLGVTCAPEPLPCDCPTTYSLCWDESGFVEPPNANAATFPYTDTMTNINGSGIDLEVTLFQPSRDGNSDSDPQQSYVSPGSRCGCTFDDELGTYLSCGEVFRNWAIGDDIPDTVIMTFSAPIKLPVWGFGGFKTSQGGIESAVASFTFFDGPNATGNRIVSTLPNPGGRAQINTGDPLTAAINELQDQGAQETELYNGTYYYEGQDNNRGWTILDMGDAVIHSIMVIQYTVEDGLSPVDYVPVTPASQSNSGYWASFDYQTCGCKDYGDLPDLADGTTNYTDYETYDSTGGPSHVIIEGLFLGDTVDVDMDGFPDAQALGDDNDNVDDEDGVEIFPTLDIVPGGTIQLPLTMTNLTGELAYLEAWIDWNGDGDFDDPNEMVQNIDNIGNGTFSNIMTINVPIDAITNTLVGFRVRYSNTDNMTPYGTVNSGEIEDYLIGIDCPQVNCLPISIELKKE